MAFENVFGNIDFQAPNRAARQDQALLLNSLAQGISNYQRGQEMDMRKRQLEQKALDINNMSEQALYKRNLGIPLTPQEEAAISTRGQMERPQIYTDPLTNQTIIRPSPWASLSSMTGGVPASRINHGIIPNQEPTSPGMTLPGAGTATNFVDDIRPMPVDALGNEAAGGVPVDQIEPKLKVDDIESPYKAPADFGSRGRIMEEESKQKAQEAFEIEKIKRQIQGVERFDQSQLQAANFANRMVETRKILDNLPAGSDTAKLGGIGVLEQTLSAIPSMGVTDAIAKGLVKVNASPDQQKYLNAATNWIRANLRKESGAVIGPQEMIDEYATYFPIAGDSKEVIEQKRALRSEAESGMIAMSAGSYQEAFGKKAQAIKEKQGGAVSWQEYFK